jgi:hypothetical protein
MTIEKEMNKIMSAYHFENIIKKLKKSKLIMNELIKTKSEVKISYNWHYDARIIRIEMLGYIFKKMEYSWRDYENTIQ